jgi:hypothetical protein
VTDPQDDDRWGDEGAALEQLRGDAPAPDLAEALGGAHVLAELRALVRDADARGAGGERVLILPGVMGSTLGLKGPLWDDLLWLDPVDVALGNLSKIALGDEGVGPAVTPLGVILPAYLALKLHLRRAGFDAVFHPWDWRGDLEPAARGLAKAVLDAPPGPVHLVGHSMGGLVAHLLLAAGPTEARARLGRVVTLGTPTFGAPAAARVVQGTHPTLVRLAALDPRHDPRALASEVFGTFPSTYQLLPWRERWAAPDLDDPATWSGRWARPRADLLARARSIQGVLAGVRPAVAARVLQVVGVDRPTAVGLVRGPDEALAPVTSQDGDGTVPRALALLDGAPAWFVDAEHGGLPNDRRVIAATADLLRGGTTAALATSWSPAAAAPTAPAPDEALPVARRRLQDLGRLLREFVGELSPPRLRTNREDLVRPDPPAA